MNGWPWFFKNVIVGGSVFSGGLAVYLAWWRLSHWSRVNFFHACADLSWAIVVGLVAEAVMKSPGLPPTWRIILYTFGLWLGLVAFLGIMSDHRKRGHRRSTDP